MDRLLYSRRFPPYHQSLLAKRQQQLRSRSQSSQRDDILASDTIDKAIANANSIFGNIQAGPTMGRHPSYDKPS